MTIAYADYLRLRNSSVRWVDTRFWLFAAPTLAPDSSASDADIAALGPMPLVSPRYALVRPGESVVLYGGDSYVRGGAPATGHTWTLESGSAILAPSGASCTVTPTGGENSEVTVRLTVTGNAQTEYTRAYIACSTTGWSRPTGILSLQANFDDGWTGSLEVAGDDANSLQAGQWLLVHIDTWYDNLGATLGGYKRAHNLALVEVGDEAGWRYRQDSEGGLIASVPLVSPKTALERLMFYCSASDLDGANRAFVFAHDTNVTTPERSQIYAADFRVSDAAFFLAQWSKVCRAYNVTVFHDPNEYLAGLVLDIGSVWEQMWSAMKSIACEMFVNFAGSVMCVPSPSVRADEWWGTPDPVLPGPLDNEMVTTWEAQQRRSIIDYVELSYIDNSAIPQTVTWPANQFGAGRTWTTTAMTNESGLACPDAITAQSWAADLLAMHNRAWDVSATVIGYGNTLNLGDYLDVALTPAQAGQPAISGRGYIKTIAHTIDLERKSQETRIEIVEDTAL